MDSFFVYLLVWLFGEVACLIALAVPLAPAVKAVVTLAVAVAAIGAAHPLLKQAYVYPPARRLDLQLSARERTAAGYRGTARSVWREDCRGRAADRRAGSPDRRSQQRIDPRGRGCGACACPRSGPRAERAGRGAADDRRRIAGCRVPAQGRAVPPGDRLPGNLQLAPLGRIPGPAGYAERLPL